MEQVPVAASRRCKSCGRCIYVSNTAFDDEPPEVLCDSCVEMALQAMIGTGRMRPVRGEIYNHGQSRRFFCEAS